MLSLKVFALFAAGALNIFVAIAVLLRGTRKLENISFFGLMTSIAGWTFGIALFLLTNDETVAFFLAKVFYFFPLLIAMTIILFVKSFPGNRKVPKYWMIPLVAGFVVLAIPLIVSPHFLTAGIVYHDWGKEVLLNKDNYLFYSIYLLICYPMSLIIMYRTSKKTRGLPAAQAWLFFAGFFIAFLFGVFFNLVLPWLGNYEHIWVGPLFTAFFATMIAYSIIRHRMFDIRLALARTVTYLLLLITLVSGYAIAVFGFASTLFADSKVGTTQNAIYVLMAILLAFTFEPLKKFFARLTNRIFFQDVYETQEVLDKLNSSLVRTNSVNKISHTSLELLLSAIKAKDITLVLNETDDRRMRAITTGDKKVGDFVTILDALERTEQALINFDEVDEQTGHLHRAMYDSDIAIVSRLETGRVHLGYLLFGFKENGSTYRSQDVDLIRLASGELAIAIQNALRFEEIEHFNETLQQEVRDATSQLRQTNRKLHDLDDAKDDFISMASHQLRTPLTSIKGYLSMVLEGDMGRISPSQRKVLEEAYTSSQRMVYLISDFLNVSRLQTGKFELERSPTNLATVLTGEIAQLQAMAQGRNLTINYEAPSNFPIINIDADKFRQVMMNFIDNAIYYSRANAPITITLAKDASDLVFKVADKGIGVPADERHKLFTKFYRASNAKKQRPDGTGIGLFMAQKVIVAHGGSVIFESKENEGSTFGFRLPLDATAKK